MWGRTNDLEIESFGIILTLNWNTLIMIGSSSSSGCSIGASLLLDVGSIVGTSLTNEFFESVEEMCFHMPLLFTSFVRLIECDGSWIAASGILMTFPEAIGMWRWASVLTACMVAWFSLSNSISTGSP